MYLQNEIVDRLVQANIYDRVERARSGLLQFDNGSWIRFIGADEAERQVGFRFNFFAISSHSSTKLHVCQYLIPYLEQGGTFSEFTV